MSFPHYKILIGHEIKYNLEVILPIRKKRTVCTRRNMLFFVNNIYKLFERKILDYKSIYNRYVPNHLLFMIHAGKGIAWTAAGFWDVARLKP
jgi:hypothetical protein